MIVTALRRIGFYAVLVVLYLISTIPVGVLFYSLKSEAGMDIFKSGGFHTYMQCLATSFALKDRTTPGTGDASR